MNRPKLLFFLWLTILVVAAILLLTASPLLIASLSEQTFIPLGSFISWLGIIALSLTISYGFYVFSSKEKPAKEFLSIVLKVAVILSALWLPICFLLAGNISFSFSGKDEFQGGQIAMKLFWFYSILLILLPILVLIIHWLILIYRFFIKRTR